MFVNIDNEEEILKKCDFDYYYNLENCSRELTAFYNDINQMRVKNYNKRYALIDLGRIGITMNRLASELNYTNQELERIKKNWRISRTQQQKMYENLKNANKKAGIVNYPMTLDGCRIDNEQELVDFAKDMVLEKNEWRETLHEKECLKEKNEFCEKVLKEKNQQIDKLKKESEKNELYFIREKESGKYYDFFDDSFVYSFDFDCFVSKEDYARECVKNLKDCGWDVEIYTHKIKI